MKSDRSKLWVVAFLLIPFLYFVTQLLPYYHSGGTELPSLGSLFWFPENNGETIAFIALFYPGFRVNELTSALLNTQLLAVFIIIMTLILKSSGVVALMVGCWGLYGMISFLTTRSLAFSPVQVYGGFASILMLSLFLAAIMIITSVSAQIPPAVLR